MRVTRVIHRNATIFPETCYIIGGANRVSDPYNEEGREITLSCYSRVSTQGLNKEEIPRRNERVRNERVNTVVRVLKSREARQENPYIVWEEKIHKTTCHFFRKTRILFRGIISVETKNT